MVMLVLIVTLTMISQGLDAGRAQARAEWPRVSGAAGRAWESLLDRGRQGSPATSVLWWLHAAATLFRTARGRNVPRIAGNRGGPLARILAAIFAGAVIGRRNGVARARRHRYNRRHTRDARRHGHPEPRVRYGICDGHGGLVNKASLTRREGQNLCPACLAGLPDRRQSEATVIRDEPPAPPPPAPAPPPPAPAPAPAPAAAEREPVAAEPEPAAVPAGPPPGSEERFFALREAGYTGAIDRAGNAVAGIGPEERETLITHLVTFRSISGRPIHPIDGGPVYAIGAYGEADAQARVAAARYDQDLEVTYEPIAEITAGNPPAGDTTTAVNGASPMAGKQIAPLASSGKAAGTTGRVQSRQIANASNGIDTHTQGIEEPTRVILRVLGDAPARWAAIDAALDQATVPRAAYQRQFCADWASMVTTATEALATWLKNLTPSERALIDAVDGAGLGNLPRDLAYFRPS